MRWQIKLLLLLTFVKVSQQQRSYKIIEGGVDDETKATITNMHNFLRLLIAQGKFSQPKGTDLKRLYWDEALADNAQKVANRCKFEHVTIHDSRWPFVGQNLYTHFTTSSKNEGPKWEEAIMAWFNEQELYTFSTEFSPATGHYTQLVWSETNKVGCGYSYFYNSDQNFYQSLYVCNYGPGGNVIGQTPYSTKGNRCPTLC